MLFCFGPCSKSPVPAWDQWDCRSGVQGICKYYFLDSFSFPSWDFLIFSPMNPNFPAILIFFHPAHLSSTLKLDHFGTAPQVYYSVSFLPFYLNPHRQNNNNRITVIFFFPEGWRRNRLLSGPSTSSHAGEELQTGWNDLPRTGNRKRGTGLTGRQNQRR